MSRQILLDLRVPSTTPEPPTVRRETRRSIRRVAEHTNPQWREDALAAVQKVCLGQEEFFCDDIWATGLESTHNDKALGPILMQAKKNGWCVKTDRVKPSRRSHLTGKPVWKSLLFTGGAQ